MQEKLAITVIVIMLALFALVLVLYNLVNDKNEEYTKIVLNQHSSYDSRILPYRRGDILDRNGTYLATSEEVYNLIIDPSQIYTDKDDYLMPTVEALVQCFGYDKTKLLADIEAKKDSPYLRYERRLSHDKKAEFEALEEKTNQAYSDAKDTKRVYGIWFENEYKRFYPYSTLACTLMGFSGSDSSEGTGGIEQYYNSTLVGTNGREYGYLNDDSNMENVIKPAINGNTVVSTIDANIQGIVEKHINQFQTDPGSKEMAVLVMNPNNGEILAMATNKRFDLNNPRDLSGSYTPEEIASMDANAQADAWNQMWRNFCVSDTYEPGSPSKVFTVSAGLEDNIITPSSHFFCKGYETFPGLAKPIKCTAYSRGGHGDLSVEEAIVVSCNATMMQIAALEGKDRFMKYMHQFGFGSKTGIDLPGEADAATLVRNADQMNAVDLAVNSFGQGYNCTMVQLAAAFSSVINGGNYYTPHVVKQILNDHGAVIKKMDPVVVKETVSESTTKFINQALLKAVNEGTGAKAKVPGYDIGGKTGTAEKLPRGQGKYLVSFCGFAPAEDPQVLVYVVIDEPQVEYQASSSYASKVFSDIVKEILPYMNIFPTVDIPDAPAEVQSQLPQSEGITENTQNQGTGESKEAETQPETKVYETDEYVPDEMEGLGLDVESEADKATQESEAAAGQTTAAGQTAAAGQNAATGQTAAGQTAETGQPKEAGQTAGT